MFSFEFSNKENHAASSNLSTLKEISNTLTVEPEKQTTSVFSEIANVGKSAFKTLLNSLTFAGVLSQVEELQKNCPQIDSIDNHSSQKSEQQYSLSSETIKTLQLPVVVVVGDENSGKSSTLERLAMVDVLPRNHQICTRQPIALLLRHNPKISAENPFLRLTIPGDTPKDAPAVFENLTAQEVNVLVHEQMLKIKKEKKGIVMDQEITIEVQSDGVPTIKLVDLPGLIAVRTFDIDEPNDLAELSEKCTRKYLDSESTGAAVCVIDATISNLRTSKAIRMIQESRKQLQVHTIGVFAKADASLAANYEEEGHTSPLWRLESRLRNDADDTVSLPFGFVALKNRNTKKVGGAFSLEEQRSDEEKFFNGKIDTSGDLKEKIGLDALIKKIDTLICRHLSVSWVPGELQKLALQREQLSTKIRGLGIAPERISFEQLKNAVCSVYQEEFSFYTIDALCDVSDLIPNYSIPSGKGSKSFSAGVLIQDLAVKSFYKLIESGELIKLCETQLVKLAKKVFDNSLCGDIKLNRFTQLRDEILCSLKSHVNEAGKSVNKISAEKALSGCHSSNYLFLIKDYVTKTLLLPIFFPEDVLYPNISDDNDSDLTIMMDAQAFPFLVAALEKYTNESPKECCAGERLMFQIKLDLLDKVENTLDGLVPPVGEEVEAEMEEEEGEQEADAECGSRGLRWGSYEEDYAETIRY